MSYFYTYLGAGSSYFLLRLSRLLPKGEELWSSSGENESNLLLLVELLIGLFEVFERK
jgi:hypothetical protein